MLAVLVYTAARVGAVAKLTLKSLKHDGTQYTLRFAEKGGKSREIPVRHDLEQFLREYVKAAEITEGRLFRTANRKTKTLTKNAMTGIDICRMMKRRLKAAGLARALLAALVPRHDRDRPVGAERAAGQSIPDTAPQASGYLGAASAARASQRLTASSDAPRASAMSRCRQPSSFSCNARNLRHSSGLKVRPPLRNDQ